MRSIFAIALAGLLSACALLPTDGGTKAVQPGREFTLDEGARADVLGPWLTVEFVGVPEDQRCPMEAMCISAGHAIVRLHVSQPGHEPATLDVRVEGPHSFAAYHDHAIEVVALDPAPSTNVPDPNYRVRLVVGPLYTAGR